MDLEQKFKKETGFNAYIDNNLEPKIAMNYYVEWLEEQIEKLTVKPSSLKLEERDKTGFQNWLDVYYFKMPFGYSCSTTGEHFGLDDLKEIYLNEK